MPRDWPDAASGKCGENTLEEIRMQPELEAEFNTRVDALRQKLLDWGVGAGTAAPAAWTLTLIWSPGRATLLTYRKV